MARGDVTVFNESKALLWEGGFLPTDDIKVAVCNNTTTPSAATATPALGDFTQVASGAGTYIAGGTSLGNLGACVTQSGGTTTFRSTVNPTWAAHASNSVNAWWGVIYNATAAGSPAIAFVELAGPVDMSVVPLGINWHASGVFSY